MKKQCTVSLKDLPAVFYDIALSDMGWDVASSGVIAGRPDKRRKNTGVSVPSLNTDITMRHSTRAVVIDTKYYKSMHQKSQFNESLRSSHLFQIYAYLRAEEERNGLPVHGVLLYARPDGEHLDQWIDLRGIPVRMFGLDLNQSWEEIESDLCALSLNRLKMFMDTRDNCQCRVTTCRLNRHNVAIALNNLLAKWN